MQEDYKTQRKHLKWYHYILILILVIAILFASLLGYLSITEFKPEAIMPAIASSDKNLAVIDKDELSIMTFNTGYAALGKKESFILDGGEGCGANEKASVIKNMEGIEAILKANPADIYMLQELDQPSHRSFDINQILAYEETLGNYEWRYAQNFLCKFVPYPFQQPMLDIDSGIVTYSKYQISEANRISLPNPFTWPISMANLKRCLLLTRLPIKDSDKELVIINMHLEAYDDGEGKIAQTKLLLDTIQEEYLKGNYVIAGGDFNQIFPEVETIIKPTSEWVPGKLDPLPAEYQDLRYVYDEDLETCRLLNQAYDPSSELTQLYLIDGYIVTPNIEVQKIETINANFEYSDHNPVMMDVKLK